jgi:hypothetical protein
MCADRAAASTRTAGEGRPPPLLRAVEPPHSGEAVGPSLRPFAAHTLGVHPA